MPKVLGEKEAQVRALREANAGKGVRPNIPKEILRRIAASDPGTPPKPKETTVKKPKAKSTTPKRTAAQASANLKKAKEAKKAKGGTKTAPKAAKRTSGPDSKPAAGPKEVRPGSKLAIVVDLLKRPEGCTTAEILKATEWPSVSVPQQARMAGLELRKEKNAEGVTVYRA